jgi:hypothetical protein
MYYPLNKEELLVQVFSGLPNCYTTLAMGLQAQGSVPVVTLLSRLRETSDFGIKRNSRPTMSPRHYGG